MKGNEKEIIHFFLLRYSISSHYLFYFYNFAFLIIAPNFLFGFVVCFVGLRVFPLFCMLMVDFF